MAGLTMQDEPVAKRRLTHIPLAVLKSFSPARKLNSKQVATRKVLITALIVATCIFLLIYIPKLQLAGEDIPKTIDRIELENKTRATLAQIIGGVFVLIGLYLCWRRLWNLSQQEIAPK